MMGTYRVEWPCCDSVTETQSWEPERCPFCELNETDAELTATRSLVTPDFTAAIRALITPAAPDPALQALARLGAMIHMEADPELDRAQFVAGTLAKVGNGVGNIPGITILAHALLAPDGADGAGEVTDA